MGDITYVPQVVFEIQGYQVVINYMTLFMTWTVMGLVILFGYMATRKMAGVPGPSQCVAEFLINIFDGLVGDALETRDRKYFPLIMTLFMFLATCNWIGVIPFMDEPTKDLNTPLSLGFMGFFLAHRAGIKAKGIKQYAKEYFEPIFFMAPLNVIGELAKVVSISFRLYGNIMGGSIIILVVSHLIYSLVLPPFLYLFFGLFVGTIQAFVFTMLTLVYISVQVK